MKRTRILVVCLGLLAAGAVLAQDDQEATLSWPRFELSGVCRVKGGFLLVDDELVGSLIFVEGDDLVPRRKSLDARIVKLERRRASSQPTTPLTRLLPIEDMEDVTSDGEKWVYILGSHASKDKKRRLEREFIVKAEWHRKDHQLRVPTVHDEGEGVYTGLLDRIEASGLHPLSVNAEGIALQGSTLWVGLRAPLLGKKTVLLHAPVESFFPGKDAPTTGEPPKLERLELSLEGGSVRGLHWDEPTKHLLILTGPAEDTENPECALFAYDLERKAVEKVRAFGPRVVRGGVPEGIVRADKEHLAVVLDGERGSGAEIVRFPWRQ